MTDDQLEFYRAQLDRCWPWLEAAVAHYGPTHTKEDVWKAIAKGDAQLWPLPNGAMVTTIDIHPSGMKEIRGWLAGGDLAEITCYVPRIEEWAKAQNCQRVTIAGRRGWLKAFDGYREACTTMIKELRA